MCVISLCRRAALDTCSHARCRYGLCRRTGRARAGPPAGPMFLPAGDLHYWQGLPAFPGRPEPGSGRCVLRRWQLVATIGRPSAASAALAAFATAPAVMQRARQRDRAWRSDATKGGSSDCLQYVPGNSCSATSGLCRDQRTAEACPMVGASRLHQHLCYL